MIPKYLIIWTFEFLRVILKKPRNRCMLVIIFFCLAVDWLNKNGVKKFKSDFMIDDNCLPAKLLALLGLCQHFVLGEIEFLSSAKC